MVASPRSLSRSGRPWRLGPRSWRNHNHRQLSKFDLIVLAALLLSLTAFVIVCVVAISRNGSSEPELAAADVVPSGQDVALPLAAFADGRAKFYRYVTATRDETRFFIVRSRDGAMHAALDACDSCYRARRGFRQVGDHMICNSCGKSILSQDVNQLRSACNPVSVDYTVDGDLVVIRAATLEQGRSYF